MADFCDAPEVEAVAKELIEEYHTHLAEARIKYLFRIGEWNSKGKVVWGQAMKVSDREKYLTGYDFIILINSYIWHAIDEDRRKALVDHELCHCQVSGHDLEGNPKWTVIGHDLEDFTCIVSRHGLWSESVRQMAEAMEKHRDPTLFEYGLEDPYKSDRERESNEDILLVVNGGQQN